MSELLKHISKVIDTDGPMSVARYMELALQHPEYGYYINRDPIGASGDFITAPEISQMFGEMLGIWCAGVWRAMGQPEEFMLLELGPGKGTLMQDALRATGRVFGFHSAMHLHFLESNKKLRELQLEKLGQYKPSYVDNLETLPDLPTIFIANEFFDALPVMQTVQTEIQGKKVLMERKVGVIDGCLEFIDSPEVVAGIKGAESIREVSQPSLAIMRLLAQHIMHNKGAGLVVDYGYTVPSGYSTLQAVRGHKSVDFLSFPGEVDLSAHVDFAALGKRAEAEGAKVFGPMGQGEFLCAMGIELRSKLLQKETADEKQNSIENDLHRLIDEDQMGSLFKAICVASPGMGNIPGFV